MHYLLVINRLPTRKDDARIHRMAAMTTILFLILLFAGIFGPGAGAQPEQPAGIAWTKTYPEGDSCEAHAIARTADGGFLVVGACGHDPRQNLLLFRTDALGNELWKTTGNGNFCDGNAVIAARDGNTTVLGSGCDTRSSLLTLTVIDDTKGTVRQNRNYEAGGHATGSALISTGDGGYLTLSEADSRITARNDRDLLINRVDAKGMVLWTNVFSGSSNDTAKAAVMAPDGGFVIAGSTFNSGSVRDEILVLKLNAKGAEQWVRTIGTEDDETAQSIALAPDGGFVIAGTSCQRGRTGNCDIHVIRTDPLGISRWDRKYGGTGRESSGVVLTPSEGGFTIAGSSDSPERGAQGRDIHIIHLNDKGDEVWTSTSGTPDYEYLTGALIAPDGSLVVTGYATDPVNTEKRTLFITSIGREGRDPPPALVHTVSPSRKDNGLMVLVRDGKSGAGVAGALVYYDGKFVGSTSEADGTCLIEKTGTGSHSVRITRPGYEETTVKTDSKTGSALTVSLSPSVIQKIYSDASSDTALDIVFVPSKTSYDCSQQKTIAADPYLNHPETFLADARRLSEERLFNLGSYSSVPAKLSSGYQNRMNIYYYWDGEHYADAFNGCAGTLPEGFWDEVPFADVAIILYPQYYGPNKGGSCEPIGCTNGMGPGTSTWFKAPANNGAVFLHESGHAIFGLMDTYCGDTYYSDNMPFPNIWQSGDNCNSDTTKISGSGSGCRQIVGNVVSGTNTCEKEYWKYDRNVDLMAATSASATFGESSTRRIQYIFDAVGRLR